MNRVSVILLCLTTLAIFYILKEKPKIDIEQYETRISNLQQEITILENVNDSLETQTVEYQKKIAAYDVQINNLKNEVNVIQKQAQIKIDAVDTFGDDELEKFFSERYSTKKDSVN